MFIIRRGGLVLGRRDYYQYCTSPEKQKTTRRFWSRNPSSRARGATPMAATSIPHPTSPPDPLDAVPSARAAPAPPGHRPISGRATRSHDPRGWVSRSTWLASAGDLGRQHSIQMLLGLTTQSFSVYKKEWEKKDWWPTKKSGRRYVQNLHHCNLVAMQIGEWSQRHNPQPQIHIHHISHLLFPSWRQHEDGIPALPVQGCMAKANKPSQKLIGSTNSSLTTGRLAAQHHFLPRVFCSGFRLAQQERLTIVHLTGFRHTMAYQAYPQKLTNWMQNDAAGEGTMIAHCQLCCGTALGLGLGEPIS